MKYTIQESVLLFMTISMLYALAYGADPMEIVDRIAQNEELIEDVVVAYRYYEPETGVVIGDYEWGCKGGKEFLESDNEYEDEKFRKPGVVGYPISILRFDGRIQYHFSNRRDKTNPRGSMMSLNPMFWNVPFTPRALLGKSLLQGLWEPFSRTLSKAATVRVRPEPETVNGCACVVVEALSFKRADLYYSIIAWIDPERNYRPLKLELHRDIRPSMECGERTLQRRIDNIELRQFDGIWFPVSGERQFYSLASFLPDGRNADKMTKEEVLAAFKGMSELEIMKIVTERAVPSVPKRKLEIQDVEINRGIPDERFRIDFPQGCRVWDDFTQIGYSVGQTPKPGNLFDDASQDTLIKKGPKVSANNKSDTPITDVQKRPDLKETDNSPDSSAPENKKSSGGYSGVLLLVVLTGIIIALVKFRK